jgi:hypothetical protein
MMKAGIYPGMSQDDYQAVEAMNYSGIKNMLASAADFWWRSSLNPKQPASKSSPSLDFGRAAHTLFLEGRQAFESLYVRRPDDLARLDAKAKAALCPNGQIVLDGDVYDRLRDIAETIAKSSDLEGGLSEVSVLWTEILDDGFEVPCKARFDILKVRGVGDLKSIRNTFGRPFGEACMRAIVDYRYDIQAAHYLRGRAALAQLVADGAIYGDHDPAWFRRVADCKTFAFQWVFFQAEGAPITWSRSLSPGNPILDIAERDRAKAIETYRDCTQTFPKGEMWVLREPVSELEITDMPGWYR